MIQQMTTIRIAADREREHRHETPLFPCTIYITDWQKGGIEGAHWHWHKDLELMYVETGCVEAECGGRRRVLQAGDGLFLNSKALHRYHVVGSEPCHMCYLIFHQGFISGGVGTIFHQKYLAPLVKEKNFPCQFLSSKNRDDRKIIERMYEAFSAAQEAYIGYEYDVRYHIGKALIYVLERCQMTEGKNTYMTPQMRRLQKCLDYLHWHYSEGITLTDLADSAEVSEREVQRYFKSILHMSPMEYLQQYRLQVAEELLLSTSDSILDVGISCGFANPSHFIKVFRNFRGCTPRVFRQRNAEKLEE